MRYIEKIVTPTSEVCAMVNRSRVYLVETDNGELLLPVLSGDPFGLELTNRTGSFRAYPTLVGDGNRWINTYVENKDVTDPNLMLADGGMWEIRPGDHFTVNRFSLPHNQQQPFIAVPQGFGYDGNDFNLLRVYERSPKEGTGAVEPSAATTPAQVGATLGALLAAAPLRPRPGDRDPSIGAGDINSDTREKTGREYVQDAAQLVTVRLVDLDTLAGLKYGRWTSSVDPADLVTITR